MTAAPSIVLDQIIDALGAFLEAFVDGAQIIRAQTNRAPMPSGPFVLLTELLAVTIERPTTTWDGEHNIIAIYSPTRSDIQIDFYGPAAADQCLAVQAAMQSDWSFDQFPANIRPLYTSDGIQSPLVSGEQQWEGRWMLTVSLQYNPTVPLPQQFADEATVSGHNAIL